MMTLLLTRHGTTLANEQGKWIGQIESPLSEKGLKELETLKTKLEKYKIDEIYTSPSQRAIASAKIITKAQGIHHGRERIKQVEALREIDFGRFDGKDFKWVNTHYPEETLKMVEQGEDYIYPDGESLRMQHNRIAIWLQDWLTHHQEGTYLICAHGGTIRCILSELLAKNASLHWRFKINPASLTVVTITQGYAVIEALND